MPGLVWWAPWVKISNMRNLGLVIFPRWSALGSPGWTLQYLKRIISWSWSLSWAILKSLVTSYLEFISTTNLWIALGRVKIISRARFSFKAIVIEILLPEKSKIPSSMQRVSCQPSEECVRRMWNLFRVGSLVRGRPCSCQKACPLCNSHFVRQLLAKVYSTSCPE